MLNLPLNHTHRTLPDRTAPLYDPNNPTPSADRDPLLICTLRRCDDLCIEPLQTRRPAYLERIKPSPYLTSPRLAHSTPQQLLYPVHEFP